jgi:hypothetical protein
MQHHEGNVTNPRVEFNEPILDMELFPPASIAFAAVCTLRYCYLVSVA